MNPPRKPLIAPIVGPDDDADRHAAEADEERRPGAVDDERHHVALEAAGLAERMGERRAPTDRHDLVGARDVAEVERPDEWPDDGDRDERAEHDQADHREAVPSELPPGELPLAERFEADLVVLAGLFLALLEIGDGYLRHGRARNVVTHRSDRLVLDARVDDRVGDVRKEVRENHE